MQLVFVEMYSSTRHRWIRPG